MHAGRISWAWAWHARKKIALNAVTQMRYVVYVLSKQGKYRPSMLTSVVVACRLVILASLAVAGLWQNICPGSSDHEPSSDNRVTGALITTCRLVFGWKVSQRIEPLRKTIFLGKLFGFSVASFTTKNSLQLSVRVSVCCVQARDTPFVL